MVSAQDRLNAILPSWYELLTQWSQDGSLAAAATDALNLESTNAKTNAKGQLQSLVSQWSAGNFKSLPEIVLLSNEDISGAQGAYADSTDTIYLNADWLLTADEGWIHRVLTEELGHSLDDQLNLVDTQGDEGEYLSYQLFNSKPEEAEIDKFRSNDDQILIADGGTEFEAQASFTSYFIGNSFYVVVNGDWQSAENASVDLGGNLITINSREEQDWAYSTFKDSYAQLWIGLNDKAAEGQMVWTSGQDVTFTDWIPQEPSNGAFFDPRGEDVTQIQLGVTSGPTWNDVYGDFTGGIGLAEIPVALNITADTPISEESGLSTITLNLYAGSQTSGNLLNGQTIYWSITGISQEDLEFGSLTGSGTVEDGKVQIQYDLIDDNLLEEENLEVSVYSDAEMQYQIGEVYSEVVADSGNTPQDPPSFVLRGNSIYTIVEGPSWTNAQANAMALGGNLVTIEDMKENEFITASFSIDGYWDQWYGSGSPNVDEGLFWIGLTDADKEGEWKWISGSQSEFRFWHDERSIGGDLTPNGGSVENYGYLGGVSSGAWDDAALMHPGLSESDGIAEINVVSSIETAGEISETSEIFTTTINLRAGSETSGNLAEGLTVYWKVGGISKDDLITGDLFGSGIITNGRLNIEHTLLDDGVFENEQFEVSVYSDAEMQYQIGDTYSSSIVDSTPASVVGTATSDASPIVISGNLTAPLVESYATTTSGRGKNKTTVGAFTEVTIDQSGPLDALVVNGGESNNTITGNGFADNTSTEINEERSAFSGVLVIDGKGGADTITSGTSGTNWLIGGGVTTEGTVDSLTGVALSKDIFDLRRNTGDTWEDAYSLGNAVINSYDLGDYIVLAKDQSQYQVSNQTQTIERLNKRGKVIGVDTVTYFEIKDIGGDLIAAVNGSGFTSSSSAADLKIVYGQNSQDPFEVVLPSATPGTII